MVVGEKDGEYEGGRAPFLVGAYVTGFRVGAFEGYVVGRLLGRLLGRLVGR